MMFPYQRCLVLSFLLCVFGVNVQAAAVKDFFSAQVPVKNRGQYTLELGLKKALVSVLVKASGETAAKIRRLPILADDLSNGHQYVEQYAYEERGMGAGGHKVLFLKASFPERTITELLQKGQLSYWPNTRPLTLSMAAIKQQGILLLANDAAYNELQQAIKGASEKFGLPVLQLPKDDYTVTSVNDIWQMKKRVLQRSVNDYVADAVMSARMVLTGDGAVLGNWLFIQGENIDSVDIRATSITDFVKKGYAWLASRWAKEYAVQLLSAENESLLMVSGIDTHQQYEQLLDYLSDLDVVDRVDLLMVKNSQLQLAISLKADVEQLRKTLALGDMLVADEEANIAYQLAYTWRKQ